jgi:hypothetical protein
MNKEYRLIREARLALLCVGDTIYFISSTRRIYSYHINKVEEDRIYIEVGGGYSPFYMFNIMETYEGKIYVYLDYRAENCEQRLKRMIEIIESPNTTWE